MRNLALSTPRRVAWGMIGASLVILVALFGWWMQQDFASAERHARSDLGQALRLVEVRAHHCMAEIDGVLVNVAELARDEGLAGLARDAAARRLKMFARFLPETGAIFVYDLKGNTVAASPALSVAVNAADGEYLRHLLADGDEPHIGRASPSRTLHRPLFLMARAVRDTAGRVVGVVQFGTEADAVAADFASGALPEIRTFGLYRVGDGAMVVHYPTDDPPLVETVATEPYFQYFARGGETWIGYVDQTDGTALVAARKMRGLPLLLTASMSETAVFQHARERFHLRLTALIAAAAMLALLGRLWLRSLDSEELSREQERLAQEALAESEAQLRLALEAAFLISFEWDIQRNRVRRSVSNDTALPATGEGGANGPTTFEEVCAVVHPDDRELFRANVQTAMQRPDGAYQSEFRILRPGGEVVWLYERGRVERDGAGHSSRLIGLSQDVTAHKQAEEALREADRRKDEFLAILAHELRNPLAPILNAVEILKLDGVSGEAAQAARAMITRQLQHLVRLIDDLLDVSRITRGKLELRRERTTLAAVLERALEVSRPQTERAGHSLSVALPADPLELDADPVRLAQVFANLLNNASKFMEKGGRIELTAARDGADAVVVKVSDTGIGIALEHLPTLFEPFSQVRSADGLRGGLGLGLSLVRSLTEMHGGTVTVRSDGLGQGSAFSVRLPTISTPAASDARPPASEPPKPAGLGRILVVDDDPDIVASLAMLLRLRGYEVETARDGLEAVEAAARVRPDVVLLDIGMPRLDGYATCRRIREQPWGAGMLILALSGWAQEQDRSRGKAAGFDAHLAKPVQLSAIEELLAELSAKGR
jgi:signal transduction histidine kinase